MSITEDNTTEKKKKKATHSLSDLDVFEISLVGKPAIGRTFLLTKSAAAGSEVSEGTKPESNLAGTPPAEGATIMTETLVDLLKSAELKLDEAVTGALDTILTNKEEVPEGFMQEFYKLAGYEVPKEEVEVEVVKEVEKIVEVEKAAPTDEKEEILKGLDDEAMALFKEQEQKIELAQKDADEAKAIAKAEKDSRVEKEFVQKAANEFALLPKTAEEFGPILKAIDEKLDKEEAKVVLDMFNVAKDALEASKQLEEVGDAGSTDGSEPEYRLKAKALFDEGKFPTIEQAVDHLARTQPKLFPEG